MTTQKQRIAADVAAVARGPGKAPAHEKYQRLVDDCKTLPPTPTAVVHPCDQSSLQGAVDAARMGLIAPILVGPRTRIEELARQNKIDISGCRSSTLLSVMPPPKRRSISSARARPRR